MSVGGAAKRYAQAAFDVAKKHGQLDDWEQELAQITRRFRIPRLRSSLFIRLCRPKQSKRHYEH